MEIIETLDGRPVPFHHKVSRGLSRPSLALPILPRSFAEVVRSKEGIQAPASTADLSLPSLDNRISTMEPEISLLRSQLRSEMATRSGPLCPISILSLIEDTLAMLRSHLQLKTSDLLRFGSLGSAAAANPNPLRKTCPGHGIFIDRMDDIVYDSLTSEARAMSDFAVNDFEAHLYIERHPFLPSVDLSLDEQRCEKLFVGDCNIQAAAIPVGDAIDAICADYACNLASNDNSVIYKADSQDGADCLSVEAHHRDALSSDAAEGNTSEPTSSDAGIERDKSHGSDIPSDSSEHLRSEIDSESTASILLSENKLDEYLGKVENPHKVILWDEDENIYLHPASGLQYDPTENVFYNWASQDENDLRTLFYKPVKGVIQLAQDDWYGEANRQLLNEQDRDKECIFSDKSKGFHPDILSFFEEKLDMNDGSNM